MSAREAALASYRAALLAGGVSEAQADRATEAQRRHHAALDAGRCPRCGGAMVRSEDSRQAGATEVKGGRWFKYRGCPCGYFCDRYEGAEGGAS